MVTLGFREPTLRMFPVDQRSTPIGRHLGRRNEVVIDFADPGSIHIHYRSITSPRNVLYCI